jgi:hypothetical protein
MKGTKVSKNIQFKARDKYGFDTQIKPVPSSSVIPEWWKDAPPYERDKDNPLGKKALIRGGYSNASFKKCRPMLDAITGGYIVKLWADVQVINENGIPSLRWQTFKPIFLEHGSQTNMMERPEGYRHVFKLLNTWIPITPPGYSCLITAPLGYKNLPFLAIPAIIDTDRSKVDLSPPMYLKEGFEGIVEKNTPMFQIIPFKRDNWKSSFSFYEDQEHDKVMDLTANSIILNHYVKNVMDRKIFK